MRQWNNRLLSPLFLSCSLFFISLSILGSSYALGKNDSKLALLLYPLNYNAWQREIGKNLYSGNTQKALKIAGQYRKILVHKNSFLLKNIGALYFQLGKTEEGMQIYKQALAVDPRDADLKNFLKKIQEEEK